MNASTISVNENIAVVPICIVITTGTVSTAISLNLQTIAGTATARKLFTMYVLWVFGKSFNSIVIT